MFSDYRSSVSDRGNATPASVTLPVPKENEFLIVRAAEVNITSSNGRRRFAEKRVLYERHTGDVENPFSVFEVTVGQERDMRIAYINQFRPYTTISGTQTLKGSQLRIRINDKDRASDRQELIIAFDVLPADRPDLWRD